MKALTLWQPYASLIALGVKTIETRSWSAPEALLGRRIAIHAAKKVPDPWNLAIALGLPASIGSWRCGLFADKSPYICPPNGGLPIRLPLGAVVATARLVECVQVLKVRPDGTWTIRRPHARVQLMRGVVLDQLPYGDFSEGRWAWILDDIEQLDKPLPATGRQGLWEIYI